MVAVCLFYRLTESAKPLGGIRERLWSRLRQAPMFTNHLQTHPQLKEIDVFVQFLSFFVNCQCLSITYKLIHVERKKLFPFFLAMLSLMNDDNCLSDWWRHLSGTNKQLFSVVLPILCVWHFMPLKSHVCLVKFSVKMLPFRGVEFSCQPCLLVQILIDTFCRGKTGTWLRWSYIRLLYQHWMFKEP